MYKYRLLILAFIFCALLLPSFPTSAHSGTGPKNIILLIGDGMGVAQLTAGKIVKGKLNLEQFKTVGLLTTHSSDKFVTDSAAAATALATGQKTFNGAISVTQSGEPLKTIVEYAEEKGKSTGIVSTSSITHATPAAFLVHVDSRKKENLIAEHIVKSGVDVLIGGGWGYFVPRQMTGSFRKDNKNLLKIFSKKMKVVKEKEAFRNLKKEEKVVVLLAPKHLNRAAKRDLTLSEMTEKAINILGKNKKGFFLMVEGSQIDWAGHNNDKDFVVEDVIDFDDAVGAAFDFAVKNGDTLVIVAADHETGGMAITKGSTKNRQLSEAGFYSKDHTAEMVPVFSYGPGSGNFGGIQDNAEVGQKLIEIIVQN